MFCNDYHVLQANAAPARQIDPRFDGHDHARFQEGRFNRAQAGEFVGGQTHSVAQGMVEMPAVAP